MSAKSKADSFESLNSSHIMDEVEQALDDLEDYDPIITPLEEERLCMENICQCLKDCYTTIKRFEEGNEQFNVKIIDQSLECFQLAGKVIRDCTNSAHSVFDYSRS